MELLSISNAVGEAPQETEIEADINYSVVQSLPLAIVPSFDLQANVQVNGVG